MNFLMLIVISALSSALSTVRFCANLIGEIRDVSENCVCQKGILESQLSQTLRIIWSLWFTWLLMPHLCSPLVSMVSVLPGKQNQHDLFSINSLMVAAKESWAFQLLSLFWWESSDVILVVLTECASPRHLLPASPFLFHSATRFSASGS